MGMSGAYRYGTSSPTPFNGLVLVAWETGGKDWVRVDRVRWLP